MNANQYEQDNKEFIWLTVHYSPVTCGWFIEHTHPSFMTRKLAKQFVAIVGKDTVYMVRGFDDPAHAKAFAIDYHEAKADGLVHRLRLD